jgi:hypothetical protein
VKALRQDAVAGSVGDREHVVPAAQERIDAGRIELRAAVADELVAGSGHRPAGLVIALRGERVEDVGHGGDAARDRDGLAFQAPRIALAVPALVVGRGDDLRRPADLNCGGKRIY